MSMKYFFAGLLFWTFSFAIAQVILPAYQGVFSKPVANANSIIYTTPRKCIHQYS